MPNLMAAPQSPLAALKRSKAAFWLKLRCEKLLRADLELVRLAAKTARSRGGRGTAIFISRLGDGWLYPILAGVIFFTWGFPGLRMVLSACVNIAAIHCIYPIIKRRCGRLRPFIRDPRLPPLLKTLDEHSFPSGHAMTLSAVLVPIVLAWPSMISSATAMLCCMCWSRVATAHHYPSDIIAGVVLGGAIGYPLAMGLFSLP
jgi:membrane-associated phospholipid phosphatase